MTTIYDILRRPLITEKTSFQSSNLNQFTFEVGSKANKQQIKEAVEAMFDVTVLRVNVINRPAKVARSLRNRRRQVRRGGYKKAIVTLKPGDNIDVFEGVL
ncbi:MAG: 50S ribosomal protein L23 [Anaerolineales bacterium]|nr:50S ribosomal protein L23 [Anaerolineales bacterium]TET36453.1 MAG: 50S ribosomal protein L23 [Anaerolineales bacterium]